MTQNKIKTIIIEDEKEDMDLMINLLKDFPQLEITETAEDVESGISIISFYKPELIFLDINLYGQTSFEILDVISKFNLNPKIIFTTAFDNYMNKAFKYSAFDYLLKPIDRQELKETIVRYVSRKKQTDFNASYKKLKSLNKKLIFNTTEGFEIIDPEKICYLEAVKNKSYSYIHMINGNKILISKPVGEIYTRLDESIFFKIHRSYIINTNYIIKVNRLKGKCLLKTENNEFELPASKEKIKKLKEFMQNFN